MNTSYPLDMPSPFAGALVDIGITDKKSAPAVNTIEFGTAVVSEVGSESVATPVNDVATLTFNADLIAGNKTNLKVNGVAMAEILYGTNHGATMIAIAAALSAMTGVSASVTAARVITVKTNHVEIAISDALVTEGNSQATITPAYTHDNVFRGVALHTHCTAGKYVQYDAVPYLTKGRIRVVVSEAVAIDDVAYVDLSPVGGKFCKTSSTNLATGGVFRSATSGAGIAVLEINLP